ncbi:MAG: hypothetical protein AAF628_10805 [Planctomycetota bacterium]
MLPQHATWLFGLAMTATAQTTPPPGPTQRIAWHDLDTGRALAKANDQPLLVVFRCES